MALRKALPAIGIAVAAVALTAVYAIFDPAVGNWAPKCLFRVVTGWDCPGCGSQRMLHALLTGDFAAAWRANAMLVLLIPYLATLGVAALMRQSRPKFYAAMNSLPSIVTATALVILWGIIRNFL